MTRNYTSRITRINTRYIPFLIKNYNQQESDSEFAERMISSLDCKTWFRCNEITNLFLSHFPCKAREYLNENYSDKIVLWYIMIAENILYDFIRDVYAVALERGDIYLRVDDALSFIEVVKPEWKNTTKLATARSLLKILKISGFIGERGEICNPVFSDEDVFYIASTMHDFGMTDSAIINCDLWTCFGYDKHTVIEVLDNYVVVNHAGSVTRISW